MSTPTDLNLIQSTIFVLIFITSTLTTAAATAAQQCPSSYTACGTIENVHFPFSIINQSQPDQNIHTNCTYPGFNLSCTNPKHLPNLHLPHAGNFTIQSINYIYQQLYITDPNNCFPNRLHQFNLSSSPFRTVTELQKFVLFSCPADKISSGFWSLRCLSNESRTVIGLKELGNDEGKMNVPDECVEMERVGVPSGWISFEFDDGFNGGVWLEWELPDCRGCEAVDGLCGFMGSGAGLEVGCLDGPTATNDEGFSNTINYALGFGIPCIVCTILLLCCCTRCKKHFSTEHPHHQTSSLEFSGTTIAPDQPQKVQEHAVKTLNNQMSNSEDAGACAICLGNYRRKEGLRTLPECGHFFHIHCIDAWLKVNATCPVCRADTPERSTSSSSKSRRYLLS